MKKKKTGKKRYLTDEIATSPESKPEPKYEVEIAGITADFKRKTDNVEETFDEFAKQLNNELLSSGAVFVLRAEGKEATITLNSRHIRFFRNNETKRLITREYLMEQLTTQNK